MHVTRIWLVRDPSIMPSVEMSWDIDENQLANYIRGCGEAWDRERHKIHVTAESAAEDVRDRVKKMRMRLDSIEREMKVAREMRP